MTLPIRFAAALPLPEYLERVQAACSRRDLVDAWSRRQVERCLREGTAVELLPGWLVGTAHVRNPIVRARAITQWNPRVVVTGALALHVARREFPAPEVADVMIRHPLNMRGPGWVRFRSTTAMPPSRMDDLVRVTPAAFSLVEAWRRAAPRDRDSAFYEAMWTRACRPNDIAAAVDATPRLPQREALLELTRAFQGGTASPLEFVAHREVFVGPEFAEFERQVPMSVVGRKRIADMLHRRARLVIELDGERYHGGKAARRDDRIRDIDFASEGYATIRFGWHDLRSRPAWCRQRVLSAVGALLASDVISPPRSR